MNPRRGIIIIGSKSDLPQCKSGLLWIKDNRHLIIAEKIYVRSQHRHTLPLQALLRNIAKGHNPPNFLIVGAGWANHLTGCCDAFLRYSLKNNTIPVIGVAFEDLDIKTDGETRRRHNAAAISSITEVPGTKVIFNNYIGEEGFLQACMLAANENFSLIALREPPETLDLSMEEAITLAQ